MIVASFLSANLNVLPPQTDFNISMTSCSNNTFALSRYLGVENKAPQEQKDETIQQLVAMATSLRVAKKVPHYTDDMFEEAKKTLQKVEDEARRVAEKERLVKEAELRKTLEGEKQAEIAEITTKFDKQVKEMKISAEERVTREKQDRQDIEKANNRRFKEMMAEFKKEQDHNYGKQHNVRMMKAQQDFEKTRLESEKQIQEMKNKHEIEMEKIRLDADEKAAKLQKEMFKVQSDMKLSDKQAEKEILKLEKKMEAMKLESDKKVQDLREVRPEKRSNMFARAWNFVAGD